MSNGHVPAKSPAPRTLPGALLVTFQWLSNVMLPGSSTACSFAHLSVDGAGAGSANSSAIVFQDDGIEFILPNEEWVVGQYAKRESRL